MSQFISSFNIRILGENTETKPKLVFLHGLLGNLLNWSTVARQFEQDFDVLLIDQRGHGKSPKPVSGYHPQDFGGDLLKILENLGWKRVNLVGHSLGARTAFWLGARHPEVFDKIIIEDMGPHKTKDGSLGTKTMIDFVPVPFSSRLEAKVFFENDFKAKYGKALADYLYGNLSKDDFGQYNWRFSYSGVMECLDMGRKLDFWNEFNDLKCPSLIIRGELSKHLPKEIFDRMLDSNKYAKGIEISDAGHWVHFDQAALFVNELKKFLLE